MFFNKNAITSDKFLRDYLWPFQDRINKECTEEILAAVKQNSIKIDKNEEEVGIEVGIWLNHIIGKLLSQSKIINDPSSPEAINYSFDMFNYFLKHYGEGKDPKKFIDQIKETYKKKVPAYQKYEFAYARSEMRLEDFEACVIAILLDLKYQNVTQSLVTVTEELHKGATLLTMNFLKEFSKKYKVVDSEVNMEFFKD